MNLTLTLIAQAVVFALFIWAVVAWIWPRLLEAIEARQKAIADGLAEAERGKNSLAEAKKETDKMLAEARARAQEIVAQAEKQAATRIEESKSAAKTEGDRLLASANAQIQQEVQSAKQQLREQVAALAVAGAEKILKREVDAKAHADMLGQLKAQL
ncbi:F0F1 ATP synthase subunit B [Usitatibacter palustris]|uniref:ATP synthase subunit b n=1 Tax=Usitatibacter palustris TaxID=2732487 RepID=A0A6M4HEK3_9PROT|nr:F0F1 ATP synthase subunit B [Usitatibacter palustris]QJR16963.1 ATP synthase subunit b [Usitatibacter palustris]